MNNEAPLRRAGLDNRISPGSKYPLHILAVLWYNDHSQEAGEVFEAITQKQTPGEVATLRGSFCAYLPLPCLSSHLQT